METIIQARQAVQADLGKNASPGLDRVLLLKVHPEPMLSPRAFAEAAAANPDLMLPKMARFYPGIAPLPYEEKKSKATVPFRFRATRAGLGALDGLMPVTVLTKDHLEDHYELTELMADKAATAGSILQFLAEMTDGLFQAVTAFSGPVDWLRAEQPAGSAPENRRRDTIADPLAKTLAVLLDEALIRQGFLAEDPAAPVTRGLEWLATLLKSRTVVALETDLPFSEQNIAQAIKNNLGQPLVVLLPTLETLGEAEREVLTVAALLPPDCIALPWVREVVAKDHPELGTDAEAGYDDPWLSAVNHLIGLRLLQAIEWTNDGKPPRICRMHRLVQVAARQRAGGELSPIESAMVEMAKERAMFLNGADGWIDKSNRWEILPLGAFAWETLVAGLADGHYLASQAALCLQFIGDYAGARPLYERAMEANQRVLGQEHPNTLTSVNNLAALLYFKGNYERAEALFNRLLQNSFDSPNTHCQLARLHLMTSRFAEAYKHIVQAWVDRADAQPYLVSRILWFQLLIRMVENSNRKSRAVDQQNCSEIDLGRYRFRL